MFKLALVVISIVACMGLLVNVANTHLRRRAFRQLVLKRVAWTTVVLLLSAAFIFTLVTLF